MLLPKVEERFLLRAGESADIGPKLVQRVAHITGQPLREDTKWLAASGFHFGYASFWGAVYGLALFFRPTVSPAPYVTPVDGLYLGSAATPPGGAVHGMCGYYAARAALRGTATLQRELSLARAT